MSDSLYLTKSQLADRLQRSQKTITRMMAEGSLPYLKLGHAKSSRILFNWDEVQQHLRARFGVTAQ